METVGRPLGFGNLLLGAVAALLFSGCNAGCWFVPCDRTIHMRATLRDVSGAPIAQAHLEAGGFSGESDANGCVLVPVHASTLDLRAEKPGYKPLIETMTADVDGVEITLQPLGSPSRSSALPRAIPKSDLTCG